MGLIVKTTLTAKIGQETNKIVLKTRLRKVHL